MGTSEYGNNSSGFNSASCLLAPVHIQRRAKQPGRLAFGKPSVREWVREHEALRAGERAIGAVA